MDKAALLRAIIADLESELSMMTEAANSSREEATNEESRAEDRFDMRSQTAAYLAAGQAKLAGDTEQALAAYKNLTLKPFAAADPIAAGALVELEAGGRKSLYFMGIQKGGMEIACGEQTVLVLTSAAPLGRQLLGKRLGDTVVLPGRPRPVEHLISSVE